MDGAFEWFRSVREIAWDADAKNPRRDCRCRQLSSSVPFCIDNR
jgi:hypothetical protein